MKLYAQVNKTKIAGYRLSNECLPMEIPEKVGFFLFCFHCMIVPKDMFTKTFLFYLISLYESAHGNAHKSIYFFLNSLHW